MVDVVRRYFPFGWQEINCISFDSLFLFFCVCVVSFRFFSPLFFFVALVLWKKKIHTFLINTNPSNTPAYFLLLDRTLYRTHTHILLYKLSLSFLFSSRKGSYLFTYYLLFVISTVNVCLFVFSSSTYTYIYIHMDVYIKMILVFCCMRVCEWKRDLFVTILISTCHFRYDTYCRRIPEDWKWKWMAFSISCRMNILFHSIMKFLL